eukprot:3476924-Pyramimonas_sp.AAC.1
MVESCLNLTIVWKANAPGKFSTLAPHDSVVLSSLVTTTAYKSEVLCVGALGYACMDGAAQPMGKTDTAR